MCGEGECDGVENVRDVWRGWVWWCGECEGCVERVGVVVWTM